MSRALMPHEFGRVLVHINQRRGARGIKAADEEIVDAEGKNIKKAISHLEKEIGDRTYGQFMADLFDEHKESVAGKDDKYFRRPIRNRRDALLTQPEKCFFATREIVQKEFHLLWDKQRVMAGRLAALLTTDELLGLLDAPEHGTGTWISGGVIFGQRRTYWNTGTLGRCDLEPTDHRCPLADMYAQEYRVLETVNNIRIKWADEQDSHQLDKEGHEKVVEKLRSVKSASTKTIRTALGVKKEEQAFFALNYDTDSEREINTDWFQREIVQPVCGKEAWVGMSEREKDAVNRAILRYDPDKDEHAIKLKDIAVRWWKLSEESADKLIAAWRTRPKLEKRINLLRRALKNLLPLMRKPDPDTGRWLTINEARQKYAENVTNGATPEQRVRYAFNVTANLRRVLDETVGGRDSAELLRLRGTTRRDRHYMRKHPDDFLPPAPVLANPVVRKAIHEVRRHLIAWMKKFNCRPDRIIVEMVKEARQSAKVRDKYLGKIRSRNRIRNQIREQHRLHGLSLNQQEAAIDRVLLCRQQKFVCAVFQRGRPPGRLCVQRQDDNRGPGSPGG